jgi:hypothetical protein
VLFFLLHLAVSRALQLLTGGSDRRSLEIENAVLRHQLAVLRRGVKRPQLRRIDRVFLAAASRLLPRDRWGSFLVSPQTLIRWQSSCEPRPMGSTVKKSHAQIPDFRVHRGTW